MATISSWLLKMEAHCFNCNLFFQVISWLIFSRTLQAVLFCLTKQNKEESGDAGDWTRGLSHAKRTPYHWATSPEYTFWSRGFLWYIYLITWEGKMTEHKGVKTPSVKITLRAGMFVRPLLRKSLWRHLLLPKSWSQVVNRYLQRRMRVSCIFVLIAQEVCQEKEILTWK